MAIAIISVILFVAGLVILMSGLAMRRAPVPSAAPNKPAEAAGTDHEASSGDSEKEKSASVSKSSPKANPTIPISIGIVTILISLGILASGLFTTVSAKNAGVLVAFGKVSEKTLSPGLHTKAPWQKVVEIDGTIQTDDYRGEECVAVRIGDGSQACVSITNRWNIVESEADRVYKDFKSDDPTLSFRDAVISTQLKASLQKALSDYNPVAQFNSADNEASSAELSFSPDYDAVSKVVEEDMKTRLGAEPMAEIQSITISYMQLSETTQKKLDDYVAAIGETRIAEQRKATAEAQAAANNTLSTSVSDNPNVLVSRCLDTLAESVEKGYQLPAGFSCWPGGGSGVVIPGASPGQ